MNNVEIFFKWNERRKTSDEFLPRFHEIPSFEKFFYFLGVVWSLNLGEKRL